MSPGRFSRFDLAHAFALSAFVLAACVKVPDEVHAAFAPAGPNEPSLYRSDPRRPARPPGAATESFADAAPSAGDQDAASAGDGGIVPAAMPGASEAKIDAGGTS